MAGGTPLIYPPRHGFAEHRSLDRSLRAGAAGVPISTGEFRSLRLGRALEKALQIEPGPPPFRADGATQIARYLDSDLPRRSRRFPHGAREREFFRTVARCKIDPRRRRDSSSRRLSPRLRIEGHLP